MITDNITHQSKCTQHWYFAVSLAFDYYIFAYIEYYVSLSVLYNKECSPRPVMPYSQRHEKCASYTLASHATQACWLAVKTRCTFLPRLFISHFLDDASPRHAYATELARLSYLNFMIIYHYYFDSWACIISLLIIFAMIISTSSQTFNIRTFQLYALLLHFRHW